MENLVFGGQQEPSAAYDYRVYDQVWKRVSPGLDPYAENPAGAGQPSGAAGVPAAPAMPAMAQPAAPQPVVTPPPQGAGAAASEANLPGADRNPCCMGSNARESLPVLEGFLEEELAGRRYALALACGVRQQGAVQLLRRIAAEKLAAARELCAAYYLTTGNRYRSAVAVEHMQFGSLAEALRSCYHQEACNGLNYQRAADETMDPCLQRLFTQLGKQSYQHADDIMALLGKLVC